MSSQVSSPARRSLNPRQAETVERLLAAALDELVDVGHEHLTVRGVAHRAGVSPATAYTYVASRNHLVAELFLRALAARPLPAMRGRRTTRLQAVTRDMAVFLAESPQLAAAVTGALLGTDPDVARVRLRIGEELLRRFAAALGDDTDPDLLETVTFAFSGALLQAGMGLMTYVELGDRLDGVVAVIMKGQR